MSTATTSDASRSPHATEWNRNAAVKRGGRVLALVDEAVSKLRCLRPPADECRGRYEDGTPQYLQVLHAEIALSRVRDLLLTPKRRRLRPLETTGEQYRMIVTGHMPPKAIEENVPTDDPIEAVEKFQESHPDAIIDSVGDAAIRSVCSTCSAPIFATDGEDDYKYDAETKTYRCAECVSRLAKGEEL